MTASFHPYYGNLWRELASRCACGWSGRAEDASTETFDQLFTVHCPRCFERLVGVSYPTREEIEDAAAAGNIEAQRQLDRLNQ